MIDASPSTRPGFREDRRGSVTILSAFLLPLLIGTVALVAEFGHGLLIRVQNQRVADLAAYAGAVAYGASSSTATMNAAIASVAGLNGMGSGAVSGALVASPSGNGNQAVSVTVATTKLMFLAPVLGTGTLPVSATASAELSAQGSACVIALSGSETGVTLSGGTQLNVPSCGVASNTSVTVPCGTAVTTKFVNYNSVAAPSQPCAGIQPPAGTSSVRINRQSTPDPFVNNAGKNAAVSRLATVNGYVAPAAPTVTAPTGGQAIEFAWSDQPAMNRVAAAGCSAARSGGNWTVICPTGTFTFGAITMGGGITVAFNTNGSATNVYKFSGSITGTAMTFGPGIYEVAGSITVPSGSLRFGTGSNANIFNVAGNITANSGATLAFGGGAFTIAQGLVVSNGSTATFGPGTFNIGPGAAACNGGARFSICHTGATLTFGGPSSFTLAAGLHNGGGSTMTLGSGTTNSYQLGPSLGTGGGNAMFLGGGAKTKLADATGPSNLFRVVGNINTATGGGSCLTLPANAQQDIKGNLLTAGGTRLGAGIYTVTGYVALGGSGGGDVTCDGATVGMIGNGVTFVIGGAATPSSGTCAGRAFCVGAGYNTVSLTAPTTGATASFAVIGPTSPSVTAGALFTEGAGGNTLSGAFYFPYGPVELSGGASVGNGAGQCLELIGSRVTLSGGTKLASRCIGGSAPAITSAKLVR